MVGRPTDKVECIGARDFPSDQEFVEAKAKRPLGASWRWGEGVRGPLLGPAILKTPRHRDAERGCARQHVCTRAFLRPRRQRSRFADRPVADCSFAISSWVLLDPRFCRMPGPPAGLRIRSRQLPRRDHGISPSAAGLRTRTDLPPGGCKRREGEGAPSSRGDCGMQGRRMSR